MHSYHCGCGFFYEGNTLTLEEIDVAHDKFTRHEVTASCCNCSGVKCMSCVCREMHDFCVNDCPDCCAGEVIDVKHVTSDRWTGPAVFLPQELLQILLEYAYRGVAAQGGQCHVEREAGCAICDSMTDAEALVFQSALEMDREWWK